MQKKPGKRAGISDKVIRILDVYTMIADNRCPSIDSLAERFGVSRRTVHRYLEIIRAIDTVDFDPQRGGYRFPKGSRLKKFTVTKNDITTLVTAKQALEHLGRTFQEGFQDIIERMIASSPALTDTGKPVIVLKAPNALKSSRLEECLRTIPACVDERRSINIVYKARGKSEKTTRMVDPYGLVIHDGVWMLIGHCHLRKQIRTFALDRISDITESGHYFLPAVGFNLEDHFAHSWGVIDGEETRVVVRFDKEIADYLLRRDAWHPSEKRRLLPDGAAEFTFTVAGTTEIKKWIYSWLPHVEVVKPASLRREIHKELTTAAKTHSS